MSRRKFTETEVEAARQLERDYENRIEMIWDDMRFDLQMRLGLTDLQTEELIEEAAHE